jgi:hypothetical protein
VGAYNSPTLLVNGLDITGCTASIGQISCPLDLLNEEENSLLYESFLYSILMTFPRRRYFQDRFSCSLLQINPSSFHKLASQETYRVG